MQLLSHLCKKKLKNFMLENHDKHGYIFILMKIQQRRIHLYANIAYSSALICIIFHSLNVLELDQETRLCRTHLDNFLVKIPLFVCLRSGDFFLSKKVR